MDQNGWLLIMGGMINYVIGLIAGYFISFRFIKRAEREAKEWQDAAYERSEEIDKLRGERDDLAKSYNTLLAAQQKWEKRARDLHNACKSTMIPAVEMYNEATKEWREEANEAGGV